MRIVALMTLPILIVATAFAAEPFNGKDLEGWSLKGDKSKSQWVVGVAKMDEKNPGKLVLVEAKPGTPTELVNPAKGVDIYTNEKFGDCTIALEVMVPKNSNSGVYVMGEYEVQVLDSWGREKVGTGDMGGLYNTAAPKTNAGQEAGRVAIAGDRV